MKKLSLEQFAELLIEKANGAEQFTIDFAADERNGEPCEWWYATHITNERTKTNCILFDMYGGGEAFTVNTTGNEYDKSELEYQLRSRDIYEIFEYSEEN